MEYSFSYSHLVFLMVYPLISLRIRRVTSVKSYTTYTDTMPVFFPVSKISLTLRDCSHGTDFGCVISSQLCHI